MPYLRLVRLHQWTKNILVFIPLSAAHQINDYHAIRKLLICFLAFSLCASSVYIINDLIDLEYDRNHPIKKLRPFAAQEISTKVGAILVPLLLTPSLLLAYWVGIGFLATLVVYFILTFVYSIWLKKLSPIDCLVLAVLYTLRVIGGGIAVQIQLSFWLVTFSLFFFFSLANLKRYTELQLQNSFGNSVLDGRGYTFSDAALVRTIGVSSGFTASLVLALYLQGETVLTLYPKPEFIWFTVPLTLFWINWLWVKAEKGQMRIDPLDYALRDKTSFASGALILACFLLASQEFKI